MYLSESIGILKPNTDEERITASQIQMRSELQQAKEV